jgi:hypothetical protein
MINQLCIIPNSKQRESMEFMCIYEINTFPHIKYPFVSFPNWLFLSEVYLDINSETVLSLLHRLNHNIV